MPHDDRTWHHPHALLTTDGPASPAPWTPEPPDDIQLAAARRALSEPGAPGDPVARLLAERQRVTRAARARTIEVQGRRFEVVQLPPGASLLPALSERERQVVALLALGLSLKHVQAELGLAISTVSGAATRAMGRLGVSGRAPLVRRVLQACDALLAGQTG